jgi:hypothetical protein
MGPPYKSSDYIPDVLIVSLPASAGALANSSIQYPLVMDLTDLRTPEDADGDGDSDCIYDLSSVIISNGRNSDDRCLSQFIMTYRLYLYFVKDVDLNQSYILCRFCFVNCLYTAMNFSNARFKYQL